ncbi:C-Jun-amino-terminal kinase-interacting protein 4 [Collichthys lucidus]|uniref:C-Jun-amino-terminal kinase-interacting protein 4 n=1 Tax=Collichthys lucidus TaxID=240159 RepID=A0A4U5V3X0_COLLU|nr:C-Jun-amino-terminal kinase-interacting protein 4 [Collichthys lucidus]
MECTERVLCGTGEVELDPNIVSEEAGKLYSELQTVIETHGEGVVESLVPTFVWVLEGLANCKAQLRDREEEAEREKAEREELLERYQAERALRKESQERYLELDDQIEQERRALRGREKERERRERELEKKARVQADQLVALEEQKTNLSRELSTLKHTHNKLAHTHRELLEKKKDSERDSPLRNHMRSKNAEFPSSTVLSESSVNEKVIQRPHSNSAPFCLEDLAAKEETAIDIAEKSTADQFINDIISSTPELKQFHGCVDASTPNTKEPQRGGLETSLEDEMGEAEEKEGEKEHKAEEVQEGEEQEKDNKKEEGEEMEEDDSIEWELRNTDSVFSELSELSHDYVESVDRGASVRGSGDQFEEILSQYEELKVTHELVDAARKALISRVVELTDDRSTLKLEVSSLCETVSRLEGRVKEKEEETKRLRKELETFQSEDPDASLTASMRHFSRSEMARVVMEKNQYKQRLFELQEAESHVADPKDVPVLMQLRLLDQRDSTAKLNCAVAVTPEISGEATCSVWVVSGPAFSSDITVIDPARSNTVLDQFSLPPTAPALCICAVPPIDGWNLQSHFVMPLGANPLQPIRCSLAKGGRLWVGYWNRVHVVDIESKKVEQTFAVSERSEQQVRFLCAGGSGVWTSCRLDPILRLFDWSTGRPLQQVDFSALVTKTLGQAFLTLSPLQISSLAVISGRLWVGTGGGALVSIPLSITSEDVSIPYCSIASAQLCYHGHRQAVRFIIAAPGCLITTPGSNTVTTSQLILSGGEGYINFRIGDDESDGSAELSQTSPQRSERSHMIIWQNPSPCVPSSAL